MIGKGATPSFFAIANYNYTLTANNNGLSKLLLDHILYYLMHYLCMNFLQQLLIQFLHYPPNRIYSYGYYTGWEGKGKDDAVADYIIFLINTRKRGITPIIQAYSSCLKFLIL